MRIPTSSLTLIVPILFISFTGPVSADQYDDAKAAYNRGDYATAFRLYKPLAEQGHINDQHNLGVMCDKGQGVPQDDSESLQWYR